MAGRGKYLDKNGYVLPNQIMQKHLDKVQKIAERDNYQTMIWSDMLFRLKNNGEYYMDNPEIIGQEARNALPENVIPVYWDY